MMLLIFINQKIFKKIYENELFKKIEVKIILYSFLALSISALFNVILESPLYAGLYWFLLGLLAAAIEKYEMTG